MADGVHSLKWGILKKQVLVRALIPCLFSLCSCLELTKDIEYPWSQMTLETELYTHTHVAPSCGGGACVDN